MTIDTFAGFLSAAATFFTGLVAIGIAIYDSKLTKLNIESSTWPVIVPYVVRSSVNGTRYYLVIKNFGTSPGTITSFNPNKDLLQLVYGESLVASTSPGPFDYLVGTIFPPGHKIYTELHAPTITKLLIEHHMDSTENFLLDLRIKYKSDSDKPYAEPHPINLSCLIGSTLYRPSENQDFDYSKTISDAILDISEKSI